MDRWRDAPRTVKMSMLIHKEDKLTFKKKNHSSILKEFGIFYLLKRNEDETKSQVALGDARRSCAEINKIDGYSAENEEK